MIDAVVFDLDGVLLNSEQVWDRARRDVVSEQGGHWTDEATGAMQGMSSPEWADYLHSKLAVPGPPDRIVEQVVAKVLRLYDDGLPLLEGAVDAVERMAERWPLGLASSSNRPVIDRVLAAMGLSARFSATVSSEEVGRGKPAPDVYLEAARRLGFPPESCLAVEDSANGIRSALAGGFRVAAVPNPAYRPPDDLLEEADLVLASLRGLTVEAVEQIEAPASDDRLDEEEVESFPASDPHSDWAGPAQ